MNKKFSKNVYDVYGRIEEVMRKGVLELREEALGENSEMSKEMRGAVCELTYMLARIQRIYALLGIERQNDPEYRLLKQEVDAESARKSKNTEEILEVLKEIIQHAQKHSKNRDVRILAESPDGIIN